IASPMLHLIPSPSGDITKQMSIKFEYFKEQSTKDQFLYTLISRLTHLNTLEVDLKTKEKVSFGQKLLRPDDFKEKIPYLLTYKEQLLAIYQTHPENEKEIKPIRVFNE